MKLTMVHFTFAVFFVTFVQYSIGVPLNSKALIDFGPRIVGGVDAPEGFAPHMMALVFGEHITDLMCGASIIKETHVLTAAHCIDAVRIGNTLMRSLRGVYGSNRWDSTEKRAEFTHYRNHEEWDNLIIKNDIGVLFLKNKLIFSDRVSAIPLEFNRVKAGEKSIATGWGRLWAGGPIADKLQFLYTETIGEKKCEESILAITGGWWAPLVNQTIEVCTLKGPGRGMCHGDSGSALVSFKTLKQFGIVSWGFPCAIGAPDIFVRISGFSKWLKDILKE